MWLISEPNFLCLEVSLASADKEGVDLDPEVVVHTEARVGACVSVDDLAHFDEAPDGVLSGARLLPPLAPSLSLIGTVLVGISKWQALRQSDQRPR